MVRRLAAVWIIFYEERMRLSQSDFQNGSVSSIFKAVIFKFFQVHRTNSHQQEKTIQKKTFTIRDADEGCPAA